MPLVRAKATIKPILEVLADGRPHQDEEIQEAVAQKLGLTPAERALRLKNGIPVYKNRTAWGLVYGQDTTYLPDAKPWLRKVDESGGVETYVITEAGLEALRDGRAANPFKPTRSGRPASTTNGSSVSVTFFGTSYPSMRAFVESAPLNLLAAVTAADLERCGNSQARAVFARMLGQRARREGHLP